MRRLGYIITFALITVIFASNVHAAEEVTSEFRNLAEGLDYEWSEEPEQEYPDRGNKLTDGVYGELDMTDPAWVGHQNKKTREVVFDLGERKSISSIKAHFLQDWPTSSILVPLTVSMYASNDKENWGTLSHYSTKLLWGGGPPREEYFVWDGATDGIKSGNTDAKLAYARYVKITFSMHTTAWTFIDEIEIWGADGKVEGADTVQPEQPAYLEPGDSTAGIHNLSLLYNGHYQNGLGDWTKERIIPHLSYVNQQGEPLDWFFDGILYLGLLSPHYRSFETGTALLEDWNWYLDKTFAEHGDMQQLNEAAIEVGTKLNQPDHKVNVVLMIPDPGEFTTDFGDVDGDGISENFNASEVGAETALENRQKAVSWYLDEVNQRWEEENYSNLDLVGMYWLHEQISTSETGPDMLQYVSDVVHEEGMELFWIPHFLAYRSHMWKDVGVDAAAFQPNYFFQEMNVDRIEDAANIAKRYGMGVEIEFDERMLTSDEFRQRYIDYLDGGVKHGYMQDVFKAYYQGNDAIYKSAVSNDSETRVLYDWLYQFTKGTYEIDNTAPEIDVTINEKKLHDNTQINSSDIFSFSWDVTDDLSGLASVSASLNGELYEEGTIVSLADEPGKHELFITASDLRGNVNELSFDIHVTTSLEDMEVIIERFEETGDFANGGIVNALKNRLSAIKVFEKKGMHEKKIKQLTNYIAFLDSSLNKGKLTEEVYTTLKANAEYLIQK